MAASVNGANGSATGESSDSDRGAAWLKRHASVAQIVGMWLAYLVLIEVLAAFVVSDQKEMLGRGVLRERERREVRAASPDEGFAPPLARWDSFWYYNIARYGYAGGFEDSEHSAGFLPLYPWAMRVLNRLTGMELFTAGLWISRLSFLAALLLLAGYRGRLGGAAPHTVVAAYLAFPSAFIFVSVYTEALFLAVCLGAFVAANRERYLISGMLASLAVLTRINGLALLPALAILGWQQRDGRERMYWRYVPAAGAITGMVLVGAVFQWIFNDPMAFSTAKRDYWGSQLSWPWDTLVGTVSRAEQSLATGEIGAVYTLLELPCLYLIVISLVVLGTQRHWPEAVFVAASAGLSLVSGTLWGLPRFCLVLFPIFFVLAMLRQSRSAWHLYLIASSLVQACVLFVYVSFRNPPP